MKIFLKPDLRLITGTHLSFSTEYAHIWDNECLWCVDNIDVKQWRSQNAEKVTHIKGRLLDQAMILFNLVPYQNGNFS